VCIVRRPIRLVPKYGSPIWLVERLADGVVVRRKGVQEPLFVVYDVDGS
jgi:hypothetical protein